MCFDIPTKESLRNARERMILTSSNEELFKLYYEVLEGLRHYRNNQEMIEQMEFNEDIELIRQQFEYRQIKIPFDYTNKNIINVHLGYISFFVIIAMKITLSFNLLEGLSEDTKNNIFLFFLVLLLIGIINLIILAITNESPTIFFFNTLKYDLFGKENSN